MKEAYYPIKRDRRRQSFVGIKLINFFKQSWWSNLNMLYEGEKKEINSEIEKVKGMIKFCVGWSVIVTYVNFAYVGFEVEVT